MSQISRLVDDLRLAEGDGERTLGSSGEVQVPWQVCTGGDPDLTVHYFTNALHEIVGVRVEEDDDEVRISVLERRTSDKLPGARRTQTATLSRPLAGRRVVDGATGRVRAVFVPDIDAAWAAFDLAAAEWLLAGDGLASLQLAARAALEDGCRGAALERIAAGARDLSEVYRERGRDVPDTRAAAKLVVDAALAPPSGDEPGAEALLLTLGAIAGSGRMAADQREQLGGLLALGRDVTTALAETGEAGPEAERLLAAAHEFRAGGGLRP